MPRDHTINIYHEIDITYLNTLAVIDWCEACLEGGWNVVSDSGRGACRGDGRHMVVLLCERLDDAVQFRLTWL
jgi:hypothetical protein